MSQGQVGGLYLRGRATGRIGDGSVLNLAALAIGIVQKVAHLRAGMTFIDMHSNHQITQINITAGAIWNIITYINVYKQMTKHERS